MTARRVLRPLAVALLLPLLLAAVVGPATAAQAGQRRPAHVGWAGWNEKGIRFHMTIKEAADKLGLEAYDGCGGSPSVYPAPRRLFIGHPLAGFDYDLDTIQVAYLGGYTRNIHVPHGIHPGMRVHRALTLMGPDAVKARSQYTHGWYEVGPHGTHAMFIQARGKRVTQAGVVWNKQFAKRIIKSPGC